MYTYRYMHMYIHIHKCFGSPVLKNCFIQKFPLGLCDKIRMDSYFIGERFHVQVIYSLI